MYGMVSQVVLQLPDFEVTWLYVRSSSSITFGCGPVSVPSLFHAAHCASPLYVTLPCIAGYCYILSLALVDLPPHICSGSGPHFTKFSSKSLQKSVTVLFF